MNFAEFCKPFYTGSKSTSPLMGIVNQADIAEFFLGSGISDSSRFEIGYAPDTMSRFFRGGRQIQPDFWAGLSAAFDENRFSREVASKIIERVLPDLVTTLGIQVVTGFLPDKYAVAYALTVQFKAIVNNGGEAEDCIASAYEACIRTTEFPEYITKAQGKYSKLKTLLYATSERPFDEFFVCNRISTIPVYRRVPSNRTIENVTTTKLLEHSKYCLIVGMGGSGKSMMMRHLFLSSVAQFGKTGVLPILVTLRELADTKNSLFDLIVDSVHRFDIAFSASHLDNLMREGKCVILLDGYDEIKLGDMNSFDRQLDGMIDRYPKTQFVMSTRQISHFVGLSSFSLVFMMPFSLDQAVELIDKLEYYPEEPKLKRQFREKLINEYYESHREFVTNPLLLTLMLMNYRRFADVPEKKYLFYEEAYQTLLHMHDHDKLAYNRVFRSVVDPSDFTEVFREFCAKSYRKGDYEFDFRKFEMYFNKCKYVDRLDPNLMKVDNFLFDACHSACLMYEESQAYHFLHRSFQEYFFACYYSVQDDTTLKKLGRSIESFESFLMDDGAALDMLYDLAPDKVERFIIMPYLEDLIGEGDTRKTYWKFLIKGYLLWRYTIYEDRNIEKCREQYHMREVYPKARNAIAPIAPILSLIMRVLGIDEFSPIGELGEEFKYTDLITDTMYGEMIGRGEHPIIALSRIPNRLLDDEEQHERLMITERMVTDENGKPYELGHTYQVDLREVWRNPEKYAAVISLWERDAFPTKKTYQAIVNYYEALKEKHAHAEELDDDDF